MHVFSSEHGGQEDRTLNWSARLNIALGSARGLAYLHHDCSPRIVHRDIKSSNILIDENLEPHVSDFGLAKLLVDEEAHVTTVVAGTFGYLAPGVILYCFSCLSYHILLSFSLCKNNYGSNMHLIFCILISLMRIQQKNTIKKWSIRTKVILWSNHDT